MGQITWPHRRVIGLLGLRRGEGGPVGLAVSTAFFSSAGLMIAQSGIDALFFARYGVGNLPVMYLFLGGVMFAAALGITGLLNWVGRGRAFTLIPLVIGVVAVVARVGLVTGATWIYAALWLVRGMAEFIMSLAIWGLAGMVTDTRQAKRFFPLIGAGAVLGQVVGGVSTRPLASSIGADNLIIVWVGTLAVVVLLATRLAAQGGSSVARSRRRRGRGAVEQMKEGLDNVRRSTLLRWMAVGAVLFSLLFFALYLAFSRAATARYPTPDELAGFFGVFFGLSTGLALLTSIFLTNRLLARFGVPMVMLILPLLYVLTFGVLAIRATFAALAVFRFAQVVWMQGGAASAWEAVINTVPADRRDQTRAFLYGGPTQAGTIIAGLIALVGERALSPTVLYWIGLVAAALAAYAMYRVRRAYPRELVAALREGRPNVFGATPGAGEPFGLSRADASAVSVAAEAISDPDPRIRRLGAHMLGDLDTSDARSALVRALRDPDPDVRKTALQSLARAGQSTALPDVEALLSDVDPEVRLAALEAIDSPEVPGEAAGETVRGLLEDPEPAVRAGAAGFLLERGPNGDAEGVLLELAAAPEAGNRAVAFRALAAWRAAGAFELALSGLRDPSAPARSEAARALAAIDPERAIEPLAAAMNDEDGAVREAVAEALGRIGRPAVAPVVRSLFRPDLQQGALSALERLPLGGAAGEVRRFAADSVARALESARLANGIDAAAGERHELLRDSLFARSEREARTALRAAALLGDRSAMTVALDSLSVADPAQRANALEVIDTVGDSEVVRPLLSLWEVAPARMADAGWLERLLHDPDDWIRACADLVAAQEGGSMTRTLTTLPLVERVMFLRKVPLFADLPPPDLKPLALVADEHSFGDGETIARQGELGDAMYVIVSGEVSVVVRGPDQTERVLAVRSAGEVIGEMAVITSQPRMAALRATGPVRVLTIGHRQFESILRERPETSFAVMRVLCQRLADRDAEATANP